MPNPRDVPVLTNAVLVVVLGGCIALLLGAPVEGVLSVADNPVSRVVVVTFAMALLGIGALSFAIHLLLHRNKELERDLEEMRELVETAHARTSALAATVDDLEDRVDTSIDRIEDQMADERARLREHARTYLTRSKTETEVDA